MRAKIVFPRRGWAELRAPMGEVRSPILRVLEDTPGVEVWPSMEGVECHWTTWDLPAVQEVFEQFEQTKSLASMRAMLVRTDPPADGVGGACQALSQLFPWQKTAVDQALTTERLLLADDMGLGKTRAAAVAAETSRRSVQTDRPTVIIGPRYAREVWRSELEKAHLLRPGSWCALESMDFHHPSYKRGASWIFVHYDIVHAWATHFSAAPHKDRPWAVIIDEAHWIKSKNAKRSAGAARIAHLAETRVFLTGTPFENRPSELWHLLTTLCGIKSFGTLGEFRRRYCGARTGQFGLVDDEPTNAEELRQRIAPIYLRRTLNDIDPNLLPKLTRRSIVSTLTEGQRREHDSIAESVPLEELVNALVQGRAGEGTLKLIDRLRKITSLAKLKTTEQYVADLVEQGHSVVVFAWMRGTVNALAGRLVKRALPGTSVYAVHGGIPHHGREANVAAFQTPLLEGRKAVLVASYGTLREGVTLTRASQVVLHDSDWKLSTILQAEKRVHRLTQTEPCISSWVLADKSIDTLFAKVLSMKADYAESVLNISEPTAALDEVSIRDIAPDFNAEMWARGFFEKRGWA